MPSKTFILALIASWALLPPVTWALVDPSPTQPTIAQEQEPEEEPQEGKEEGESGDDEQPLPGGGLTTQEKRALEKRVSSFYYSRKRVRCSYCDGRSFLVCPKCKGKGKLYKYYPNTGKVDWDKTKNCPRCLTAGKIDCTRRSCVTGFEEKGLRKVFWDMRSPDFRELLEKELGVGELYVEGYLQTAAILHCGPKAEKDEGVTEIADRIGVDPGKLEGFVQEQAGYKDLVSPFTKFKVIEADFETKVRVRELRNGKVVREFFEITEWVRSDGQWFLRSIRRDR
jgi:hypothetical protein